MTWPVQLTLLEINVSWTVFFDSVIMQCSFHSQYFPIDQTAIFILIAIYNLFFNSHFWQFFLKQEIIAFTVMLLFSNTKLNHAVSPNLWLRRNNGTFTVLRCTVGIRCFTVSVYFLLQINFFKSTFDFYFFDLFGLSLFLWKILIPIFSLNLCYSKSQFFSKYVRTFQTWI